MVHSFLVGLISWLLSIFLYSPRLTLFLGEGSGTTRRDELLAQCVDPLTRNLSEPILSYRIIQPLMAHSLGWCGERRDVLALLGSPGIAYIALILSLAFFHFALKSRFTNNLALIGTLGLATTQFTQWVNTFWGHDDSLTFLPTAILLSCRQPLIVIFSVAIGLLNDERMILSLPFLLLWWWPVSKTSRQSLLLLRPQILSILTGILFALAFREALSNGLIGPGIKDPYEEISLIRNYLERIFTPSSWPSISMMVFLGLRWLWIIPSLAVLVICRQPFTLKSGFFLMSLVGSILVSCTVADISRSTAFMFPAIPFSLQVIRDQGGWSEARIRQWLRWLLGLNVLTPAAIVFGLPPNWWNTNPFSWGGNYPIFPLPVNLWQWFRVPNGAASW